jgi:hypothetical protein
VLVEEVAQDQLMRRGEGGVPDRRDRPGVGPERAGDPRLGRGEGGDAFWRQEAPDARDEGDRRRLGDRQAVAFVGRQPRDALDEPLERGGRIGRAARGRCRLGPRLVPGPGRAIARVPRAACGAWSRSDAALASRRSASRGRR